MLPIGSVGMLSMVVAAQHGVAPGDYDALYAAQEPAVIRGTNACLPRQTETSGARKRPSSPASDAMTGLWSIRGATQRRVRDIHTGFGSGSRRSSCAKGGLLDGEPTVGQCGLRDQSCSDDS